MKKVSIFLLIPVLLGCKSNSKNKARTEYDIEHIVIFGVDGAGGEFENIDTPNFDRVFGGGSINYHGVAVSPTISAQNWGSMTYGVGPEVHQKTNAYIASNKHEDESLPSFIRTYAKSHPRATYFSSVNWKPINYGLFEDIPRLEKCNITELYPDLGSSEVDEKVALSVVERLQTHADTIVFTHFDSVDHAGHSNGNQSNEYKNAIKHIDEQIGLIYDAYKSKNLLNTTLFICVSDHGHTEAGGHGGESASEKAVTIAVSGGVDKIIQGSCDSYSTTDLAPIVLHALKEDIPSHYSGRVPNNMFKF